MAMERMNLQRNKMAFVSAAAAALTAGLSVMPPPTPAPTHSRPVNTGGPVRVPSYTKKGPGRKHRGGKPKVWPFAAGETAHEVTPERKLKYMNAAARRRAIDAWRGV